MSLQRAVKHGLYGISWVTILATLGTMCLFYYLYFFQGNPPIVFLNLPFPVDQKVYHPGDTITLLDKYDRRVSSLVTRSVYLVDSYPIPLELTTDGGITPVGTGTVLLTFTIPPNYVPADGDDYYISGVSVYHVNFLRDRAVPWRSETFRIVPPAGVSPRPSVHHASPATPEENQALIQLIERSHSSSSAGLSAHPASAGQSASASAGGSSASASPESSSASASSSSAGIVQGVVDPLLNGVNGALQGVASSAGLQTNLLPALP